MEIGLHRWRTWDWNFWTDGGDEDEWGNASRKYVMDWTSPETPDWSIHAWAIKSGRLDPVHAGIGEPPERHAVHSLVVQ